MFSSRFLSYIVLHSLTSSDIVTIRPTLANHVYQIVKITASWQSGLMSRHVPSLSVSPGIWRTSHLASHRRPPAILALCNFWFQRSMVARNIQKHPEQIKGPNWTCPFLPRTLPAGHPGPLSTPHCGGLGKPSAGPLKRIEKDILLNIFESFPSRTVNSRTFLRQRAVGHVSSHLPIASALDFAKVNLFVKDFSILFVLFE